MKERIRPFSNGMQYEFWTARNCEHCKKAPPDDNSWPECEIMAALIEGYVGDGTVSEEIARRMHHSENADCYSWDCGEFEQTCNNDSPVYHYTDSDNFIVFVSMGAER